MEFIPFRGILIEIVIGLSSIFSISCYHVFSTSFLTLLPLVKNIGLVFNSSVDLEATDIKSHSVILLIAFANFNKHTKYIAHSPQ